MGNSHCDGWDKLIDILTCKCPLRPKKKATATLTYFFINIDVRNNISIKSRCLKRNAEFLVFKRNFVTDGTG